ncbi:phenylalanine--tRNA ligase subunit beta [Anthocerotibacter panamensis]|uniref:phenylalanine--tRNA ligase subunit beta n=1 Tax=Anthocerotibacter panamensis TaxID=2857077 RepID=UPI001C405598|nr:phenylalanine--tRNA ligase subunit beta [Anthocerotibacter panamensis]
MKISYNWLKELVAFNLTPAELAERLTLVGFEVEDMVDLKTWAQGVVVGQILACEPHPQADKLKVCTVDVGQPEPLTIVCGAANARAGILAPVALVGTYLPHKSLTIEVANKRGVVSSGMICSLEELGLVRKSEGIHVFDQELTLGADVRPFLGLDDVILDVTSTANRADALSMVGIAREVAAFTGSILRLPVAEGPWVPAGAFRLAIDTSHACPAYFATVVGGLTVAPSPPWLAQKVERAGMRSINNVVDITNLVLLEWGQPLHAFDRDLLPGSTLGVRLAREGEVLTTLDSVTRTLVPQNLLITHDDQPVALAGVMGGAATEVNSATKAILLEAALFDPAAVRRSARAQGLRSEASARYERGVDFSALETALNRALALLAEVAGGTILAQDRVDYRTQQSPSIVLRPQRVTHVLGRDVGREAIETSLKNYGFDVDPVGMDYQVRVPGFRARDIQGEIDLIEEIARWVGFDHFPPTLPQSPLLGQLAPEETIMRRIRALLRAQGLTELYHNSFTPLRSGEELSTKRAQAEARFGSQQSQVILVNPLNADYGALRSELLAGLFAAYGYNLDQGNGPLNGFELGRVLYTVGTEIREVDHLGAILGGDPLQGDWQDYSRPWDFFAVKGILENLAQGLGLSFSFDATDEKPRLHPGRSARLTLAGEDLGFVGQVHPRLAKVEGFPEATFVFELDLEVLVRNSLHRAYRYRSFSSYPALDRDLACFVARTYTVAQLTEAIRMSAGDLLESVVLFDEYTGPNVPPDQRSLAFRLVYRAADHTLNDAEVSTHQERVRNTLVAQFAAQLRS